MHQSSNYTHYAIVPLGEHSQMQLLVPSLGASSWAVRLVWCKLAKVWWSHLDLWVSRNWRVEYWEGGEDNYERTSAPENAMEVSEQTWLSHDFLSSSVTTVTCNTQLVLWCGSLSHRYFCAKKTHVTKNSQFLIPLVKMLLFIIRNFWQKEISNNAKLRKIYMFGQFRLAYYHNRT